MTKEKAIKLFHDQKVRVHWGEDQEKWYFSIVDVISILAENDRPGKYWNDLKRKLRDEGSELSEKIGQLKMPAPDGKMRLPDVADTEQFLRLIQSIPSPKLQLLKSLKRKNLKNSPKAKKLPARDEQLPEMQEDQLRKKPAKVW